jgi:ankyrin repeat protein
LFLFRIFSAKFHLRECGNQQYTKRGRKKNHRGKVKEVEGLQYQILIFGRTYLKEMLTTELQIYSIYEIEDLKNEDMKEYIHQHLKGKQIKTKSIELIAGKILENYTKEIDSNILKVPLLLFIVLEIVSGYQNLNHLEEIPSVSEMYRRFIEGRLQHNLEKAKYNYADRSNIVIGVFKHYYLKEYQIAALKSCLDPKVLERLNISPDRYFVNLIKDRGDFLGLVTEISALDTFVFYHHTFAEYFVALWLSENIEKLSHEERRFIFEQKYNRVRYFFDTELAENCPFHQAVLKQNVSEVQKLAPEYLNQEDRKGRTPLHLASSLGQKYPISEDIKIRNNQYVKSTKSQTILQCLLNMEQMDPLQKDKLFQWNCFEYADASLCLLALEELSKKGKFIMEHLTNYRNVNSLCNHCVCLGCTNVLSTLIKFQGLSNLDRLGKPLLHLAIEYGQNKVIQLLLDNGADLFRTCSKGRTPLHEAVMWGHFDILTTLLDTNLNTKKKDCRGNSVLQFDINKEDDKGNTPLQFAAELGYFHIVKLLIERGAKVNTTDNSGKTPLHKAASICNTNIVEHLIDNVKVVKQLLYKGYKSTLGDKWGFTPLHRAAYKGHKKVVKLLLDAEFNVNARNHRKETPLHGAAHEGFNDVIDLLISEGANFETVCEDKKTCLHEAAINGMTKTVRHLVKFFNNIINNATTEGETALHIAAKFGYLPVVQELVSAKADINITNGCKKTA